MAEQGDLSPSLRPVTLPGRSIRLTSIRARGGQMLIALAGLAVFAAAWWLVGRLGASGFYGRPLLIDTPGYLEFGDAVMRGAVPYRDVPSEYPPLALPMFLLPYLLGASIGDLAAYSAAFESLMLVAGLATVLLVFLTLRRLGASRTHLALGLGAIALSPLLLGPVVLSRYDLWPALLTAAAVAATVAGHHRFGAAGLGLAIMAKVYPVVILPLLVVYVWRGEGRREALRCLAIAMAVVLAVLAPFLVLAPDGLLTALARQLGRPLQVESLAAAPLLLLESLTDAGITIVTSAGSQNLAGTLPDLAAGALTIVQLVAVAGVWLWFLRDPAGPQRLVRAAAAAVVAWVAFGRVLSPQYLIWLLPLVPLVGGRRGLLAGVALVGALVLTQAYFPGQYDALVGRLDKSAIVTVIARDLALVAVFAALLVPREEGWPTLAKLRARSLALARAVTPGQALVVVVTGAILLRLVWLTLPQGVLIFDEAYYVNAARAILGWPIPADAAYADAPAGLDPNTQHPPLGKIAMAGSMLLLGDNGLGWRLPSIIAGLAAMFALYRIVRVTGGGAWLATLAVLVFSLDNLAFVHSRIGVLDMLALGTILLGAWLGLSGRPALAGAAFGVGCLFKVTGIFGLLAYLLLAAIPIGRRLWAGEGIGLRDLREPIVAAAATALVGLGGLWLLDLRFTQFSDPFGHVAHILGYGMALTGGPTPDGIASRPWEWLVNGGTFDYLRVNFNTVVDGEVIASQPTVWFQGALNPVLIGGAALVIPFALLLAIRRRDRLAQWGIVWIAANYLPFYVLVLLSERIMYLYYVLPVVPAVAALTALYLVRTRLPAPVVWGYLTALTVAFVAYFPFRKIP